MDIVTSAASAGPTGQGSQADRYFLLMDPEWAAGEEAGTEQVPPIEAIIGLWPVEEDGAVGRFRSNPEYRPRDGRSPSDPIDALLRLAMRGDAEMEQLQLILRDSLFDLAMNGDGRPLVVRSPDDVSCVVLATSGPHRERIPAPSWRRIDLEELVQRLADDIDVLINPEGPATVRLMGNFIRETVMMSDEEIAAARQAFQPGGDIAVVPWEIGDESAADR